MPIHHAVWPEHRVVIAVFEGRVAWREEIAATRRALVREPTFARELHVVYDLRWLDTGGVRLDDVRDLAESSIMAPGSRRAVLVATPAQFGLGQMFRTVSESAGHDTRIFGSAVEACGWLGIGTDPVELGLGRHPSVPWRPGDDRVFDALGLRREGRKNDPD